ncbi:MAG: SLC13 family permease [Flavobacteriales bacterium]|nr:SLC13 family permease [Flavobacteriales bacterium]
MIPAEYHIYVASATLVGLILALFRKGNRAALTFFMAVLVLIITGVLTTDEFLKGFGNRQIAIIFMLIFITGALRDHFNLLSLLDKPFKSATTVRDMILRMTSIVAFGSSVLNNTPVVALMIPYIGEWSKKRGIAASQLLIPLSYAAILGGMITLIGTSTNLVLNGFLEQSGEPLFSFFDFLIPGLLVTAGGIIYLVLAGPTLLPQRQDVLDQLADPTREYMVETKVRPGSRLIGKSVQEVGLRNLNGVFLIEIVRTEHVITPVEPEEVIEEGDSLMFVGETERIVELVDGSNGLELSKHTDFDSSEDRTIVEAVIPANSSLIGSTVKQVNFRERYQAGILAIHRNGERVSGKIGEIRFQAGDLLLLTTGRSFARNEFRFNNLYIVKQVKNPSIKEAPPKRIFLAVVGLVAVAGIFGHVNLFMATLILLAALLVLGFVNVDGMKKEMDVKLLLILVSALALGKAMTESGAADLIASGIGTQFKGAGPIVISIVLFAVTFVLTSFITNAAAVSIVFPIAYSLATATDTTTGAVAVAEGYYMVIAFAASCAFITPMGYQTNLMVMGPGGYQFRDFMRIGGPLSFLYAVISLTFVWIRYGWI